jgi:hypothetical protein
MNTTKETRQLLYQMTALMPTLHQKRTFEAFLLAFLNPHCSALPEHNPLRSASSISRFLNHYAWPTRALVRHIRSLLLDSLWGASKHGRDPFLKVIVDVTCIEKTGRFTGLGSWINAMHGKVGLHLVMVYLELGRIPGALELPRLERERHDGTKPLGTTDVVKSSKRANGSVSRGGVSRRLVCQQSFYRGCSSKRLSSPGRHSCRPQNR